MNDIKKCKRCKKDKKLTDFYNENRCQSCKDYADSYYKNNREQEINRALKSFRKKSRDEINIYKRDLYQKTPLGICLQQARYRSKKYNIPFNITIDDLNECDTCPVLGIPLQSNTDYAKYNSYSIDRIIPELGYVKGNVCIISYKANTIKNNATLEELEKVVIWLKAKLEENK